MSSQVKSIFGVYADRLQVGIDSSLAKFAPIWYDKYFQMGTPQPTLTYATMIGRNRIEAAASIVNRDSKTPLRSRQGLERYNGEIPAIKESWKMTESDYRDFLTLQSMSLDDTIKRNQALDLMFGDVIKAGTSVHKRLDIMAMEAISTGSISLTTLNNPDGTILDTAVDLLMPAAQKTSVTAPNKWSIPAVANPIIDIQVVLTAAMAKGVTIGKIIMSEALWYKFINTQKVIDTMATFFYGPKFSGSPLAATTIDNVNTFMASNGWPMIEINREVVGIEKDGVIATIKPFNQGNVSFVPVGTLGTIKNAIAIEQIRPVDKVNYGFYKGAVISKWSENEPFGEWTKAEFNAVPSFESIDSCFILTADF